MIKLNLICVIVGLLLASCNRDTVSQSTSPSGPKLDTEYLTLVKQAQDMSVKAEAWNVKCGERPFNKDCQAEHAELSKIFTKYLGRALQYRSEGTDCRAVLRQKIINFNIQIALFNIKCAGQELPPDCVSESAFIEQERVDLRDEMAECQRESNY